MKICKGCGVQLQDTQKNAIGYTPNIDGEYCQRCFRIRNYNDVVISMKQGIDSEEVLAKVEPLSALVLWIVDLFDFEANMLKGLNRHFLHKDIILIETKRDLLPDTLQDRKLANFIMERLKEFGIQVKGIVLCGDLAQHAYRDDNYSVEEVWKAISLYRNGRDVVIVGMANAGKSTLLNALLGKKDLTTSYYPGTTLDVNKIAMEDYTLYDTPGLTRYDSLLTYIDDNKLKDVVPSRQIKPRVYQLRGNQTLSVGGFIRLDLIGCEKVSCVGYFSDRLTLHRSKQEQADTLWKKHLNGMLSPSIDQDFKDMKCYEVNRLNEKTDVVIHGVGWFTISGEVAHLRVYVNKKISVTFRKAMI